MSSNYELQRQLTMQRMDARRQEAEEHRRGKQAGGRAPFPLPLKLVIPALLGAFVAIWLLSACTVADSRTVYAETAATHETSPAMADRIRFQDRLEAQLEMGSLPTSHIVYVSWEFCNDSASRFLAKPTARLLSVTLIVVASGLLE